jgi:hypothetical protein
MKVAVNVGFTKEARTVTPAQLTERRQSIEQLDDWLTVALEDSFPCSDPISSMRVD